MSFERQHPILRGILTALSLASLALPALASAETEGKVEKVVVRNRIHHSQGKWEVNPGVGFSLSNQMTEHINFELGLAYNIWETFALELRGGYAMSGLSSVAEQVQEQFRNPVQAPDEPGRENLLKDFKDLWQLQWSALVLPRWQPIYGKVNLVTELPVHFQLYLTAGGGMVGLHRESTLYYQGGQFLEEDRQSFAIAGGGGMRFWLADWAMFKVELLDIAYPDQYLEQVSRYQASLEAPGAEPLAGQEAASPGWTNLLFINVGTSFQF